MKKSRIALIAAACFVSLTFGQSSEWATDQGSCFNKGSKIIQGGMGFFMGGGPIGGSATFEYGFLEAISGGGGFGISGYHSSTYLQGHYTYTNMFFAVRACFHPFNLKVLEDKIPVRDKVDVYAGPVVGFEVVMDSWHADPAYIGTTPVTDADASTPYVQPLIGARYFFTPGFSVFLEEGSGFGWINSGVAFKF
jgi:hypothetical protein